jgi:hypothetical protein
MEELLIVKIGLRFVIGTLTEWNAMGAGVDGKLRKAVHESA